MITPTLCEGFTDFHARNPHVLSSLIDMMRRYIRTVEHKTSVKMCWNVLRWQREVETRSVSGYKLSDAFQGLMTLLISHHAPDMQGWYNRKEMDWESQVLKRNFLEWCRADAHEGNTAVESWVEPYESWKLARKKARERLFND